MNGNISLGLRKATADLVSSGGQRRGYCCTLLCTGLARHLKRNALSMTLKFTGQITKSQCHSVWRCKNQRNSSETWKLSIWTFCWWPVPLWGCPKVPMTPSRTRRWRLNPAYFYHDRILNHHHHRWLNCSHFSNHGWSARITCSPKYFQKGCLTITWERWRQFGRIPGRSARL